MRARQALLVWGVALGCATAQPPAVFSQLEQVRQSPAAQDAEQWAPQAHAHALELERKAHAELEQGDTLAAELLSRHAIVAHEQAAMLARLARAEQRKLDAEAELGAKQREIEELTVQQQRLSGEAAGLELQAKVMRGAMPLPAHGAASPERRAARVAAAAALASQARLLCVAAGMLGGQSAVAADLAELDELDAQLAKRPQDDALQRATRLRSACLSRMSDERQRRSTSDAPHADALLSELSALGATPSRDDRGVVVVARDLFEKGGSLSSAGQARLERLADIAKSFPQFPLLVVGHAASTRASSDVERQLEQIKAALLALGAAPAAVHNAGARQPLFAGQSQAALQRNARIDFVFIAPGA